jgi:hypothetical protein
LRADLLRHLLRGLALLMAAAVAAIMLSATIIVLTTAVIAAAMTAIMLVLILPAAESLGRSRRRQDRCRCRQGPNQRLAHRVHSRKPVTPGPYDKSAYGPIRLHRP